MNENDPTDTAGSQLSGVIGNLGENLTFQTDKEAAGSGLPIILSVWKPELISRAQAVAIKEG